MTAYRETPWSMRTLERDGGKLYVVEGDIANLDRMFTDLPDEHPGASHSSPRKINDHLVGEYSFFQARTYEEVRNHATVVGRGDVTDLVRKYLADPEMRETIALAGQRATRPRTQYGDEGEEVDMDRMYAGEEDTAWRRIVRTETVRQSRVVVVDVNIICRAFLDQESFMWNGVQTAVIVDALEAEGYRVEVNALQVVSLSDEDKFCSRVLVKRADEPLRIDLLAYQTGCAAMARSALWRCQHVYPGSISGYGWNDLKPSQIRALAYEAAPEDRKPDHILPLAETRGAAMERILKVIGSYRVEEPVAA